ncbi:MAG: dockerin type I domain-containing protein [Planctomycetota bacterium]
MPSIHGAQGPQLSLSSQLLAARGTTAGAKGSSSRAGHQPGALARSGSDFASPAKATSGPLVANANTTRASSALAASLPPTTPVATPPAGVLGDIDGDGQMTAGDAKALLAYLFHGGAAPVDMSRADVNGDGSVNVSDATHIFELANAAPAVPPAGDMDGDGQVTAGDGKMLLHALFGDPSASHSLANADFNGDGSVNISDAIGMLNLTLNPMLSGKGEERTSTRV